MKDSQVQYMKIVPPRWARGGHAQTILGHFLRRTSAPRGGESVCLTLPDGDQLSVRVFPGSSDAVIYLFHGLGGSSSASYISRIAKIALKAGHSVISVNHRGCGEGRELVHSKPYHSGSIADASEAIAYGRSRFGSDKKHIAVGFSLSANILLLLAGTKRGTLPDAVIAVNAPIDLEFAAKKLHQGLNRVYDLRFVRDCIAVIQARRKAGRLSANVDVSAVRTVYDLDAAYTAQEAGFESREDYYRKCSSGPWLREIGIPTIILMAKDDPFIDYCDYLKAVPSPSVRVYIAETGGHMGYLARGSRPFRPSFWMDGAISDWIEDLR